MRICESLMKPYVEPPDGAMSFAQGVARDVSFWMSSEAIERAIHERRHWPDWETAALLNR